MPGSGRLVTQPGPDLSPGLHGVTPNGDVGVAQHFPEVPTRCALSIGVEGPRWASRPHPPCVTRERERGH